MSLKARIQLDHLLQQLDHRLHWSNATYTVTIKNFTFQPSTLTIEKGTTITWVNEDSVAHTVTSDDGKFPSSGNLNKADAYQFQFNTPGSYDYHCSPHPFMKGKINVEA